MSARLHAKTEIPSKPKSSFMPLLQRHPKEGADSALVPPVVREVLRSPGQPLDPDTRAFMEPHFGHEFGRVATQNKTSQASPGITMNRSGGPYEREAERASDEILKRLTPARSENSRLQSPIDLSQVRVHADARAGRSARAIHAQAYTFQHNIIFGTNQYAPHTAAGLRLLAHELTHVVQQRSSPNAVPHIQRRVIPNYSKIQERLSYRVFLDWVITDKEAHEVLVILNGLSDRDLADTVTAMDRDGLVVRLLNNLSAADEERYAVLIGRIDRYRSLKRSTERILDRLTRGLFDWVVTDQDAREALYTLMGLDPHQLRTVVAKMVNNNVFDTLLDELPEEEHRRFAAFIERLREIRDEFKSLVTAHTEYLRSQPGGAGRTVSRIRKKTGYGGSRAKWPDLSQEQQRAWRDHADAVIAEVIASVRGTDLEPVVARSHLVFAPERAEELGAYAFVRGSNTLYVSRSWVANAHDNPVNVWQSIAHELGGHEEFGGTWGWEIIQATMRRLTPAERREAERSAKSLYSAFGYPETEIYAELRELPHRIETSGGDRPERGDRPETEIVCGRTADVYCQIQKIRDAFGVEVGRQIVLRLYYRVMQDPRVTDASKRLLYKEIQAVFGLFPIVKPIRP